MRLNKCLGLLLLMIVGCQTPEPLRPTLAHLDYLAADKSAIVISCLRCGCIDDELGALDPTLLNGYAIFADTNCMGKPLSSLSVQHIPQARLDSIAPDLYNMLVLIREKDGSLMRELITTESSAQIVKVLKHGQ